MHVRLATLMPLMIILSSTEQTVFHRQEIVEEKSFLVNAGITPL